MRTGGMAKGGRTRPLAGLLALLALVLPLLAAPACALAAPQPQPAAAAAHCHPGSDAPPPSHRHGGPEAQDCCADCVPVPAPGPVAGPVLEAPAVADAAPAGRFEALSPDLAAAAPCPPARGPPGA